MLTALATGHDGSLCTVHAGSAAEALRRLETLALMADVGLPHAAIREQVADAIDLVVCQARAADGSRRVTGVAEVVRVAGGAAAREIYSLRNGRATWRAPLGDGGGGRGWRRASREAARARGHRSDERRHRRGGGMSAVALLAAAAGACGVLGGWEGLSTAEAVRVAERLEATVAPLGRARREGLAPSGVERRRLAWLAAGSLFAAGWLLDGPLLGLAAA